MFSRLRLGTQLWITVSLLIASASAGLAWYLGQVQTRSLTTAAEQRLALKEASLSAKAALMARNTALASASAAVSMDFDFLQGVMTNTSTGDDSIDYAYIADASGKVVVHTDRTKVGTVIPGSGKLGSDAGHGIGIALVNERTIEAAAPINLGDEIWGVVRYGISYEPVLKERVSAQEQLDGTRRRYRTFSFLITLPLILASMIISVFAATRLVRPLRSLEATMQQVLARDASLRVDVPKLRELARVATGFNILLARLEERQKRLRAQRLQADLDKWASERQLADGARHKLAGEWRQELQGGAASASAPAKTRGTLRLRLVALMLGLAASSIAAVSVVLYERLHADLDVALADMSGSVRLDLVGKGLAITRSAALAVSQAASVREYLFLMQVLKSTISADPEVVTGYIKDPKGRVLIHNDPSKTGSVDQVAEHDEAMRLGRPESRFVDSPGRGRILEVTAPIEVGNAAWGTLSFGLSHEHQDKVLGELKADQDQRVRDALTASAVGVAAMFLITLLAALVAAQRIVGPLNRLSRDLEKICAGELSRRVEIHSCHELSTFSMSINELTAMTLDQERALAKTPAPAATLRA